MKYSEITFDAAKAQNGTITVQGQMLQLCDHVESIDGQYYATTFPVNTNDATTLKNHGARFALLANGLAAIYLPTALLEGATPADPKNAETCAMLARAQEAVTTKNAKRSYR